jgi:serine/threonine protein phosphatase PrpC
MPLPTITNFIFFIPTPSRQNRRSMDFDIAIGLASAQGPRTRNEDFAAVQRPVPHEAGRGWIAALADGVSGPGPGGSGLLAAQTTVMALLGDYHATPAHWDTTTALDRLISAQNAWLAAHNRRTKDAALTTLSCVVLRGHAWTVAHVGDSRVWLLRGGACRQLTQDHALDSRDFARLTRAVGLDDVLRVDYCQGELSHGDVLLLTSDGVHGRLSPQRLAELAAGAEPQAAADALVQAALAAGGRDNATALLLQVRGLAPPEPIDPLGAQSHLPVPPPLQVGMALDGLTLTAKVADNGVHRLYQARGSDGRLYAIKTLCEGRALDPQERAMLAHEGWLGRRLGGQAYFVAVRPTPEASALYLLFDWHAGRTLEQLMARAPRPALAEFLQGATAMAQGLALLHRAGVVHRDIKPANLHCGDDGQWRLLDLGVALSGREPEELRSLHAGTPSYINPEQWRDPPAPPDAGSDLFALGVTLYQWLSGRLPYGEIEPYQAARYRRDPGAPSRIRPEVPIWLDHVLLKAVHRDASQRFETAEELLLALERGAARPLNAPPATPLIGRHREALLQIGLALSLLLNLLLMVWLLFLPR